MKNLVLFAFIALLVSCTESKTVNTAQTKESEASVIHNTSIQLIRNATLKVNYNGKTLLIDPSLSPKNSFMSFVVPDQNLNPTVDLPMSIDNITKDVDALLVTHTHLDHFDQGAMDYLDPSLLLYGQPFDTEKLKQSSFNNISIIENTEVYAGITITRTGGKHGPEQMLEGLGEVSGFVLEAKGYPTIYIIGDCLLDEEIKGNIQKYQPNIIVANSGGAEWGGAKILMDENDVVELAQLASGSKVIAVHMEALDHCKTTRKMVEHKAKEGNVSVLTPADGEIIKL